jgi:hypothetical protein
MSSSPPIGQQVQLRPPSSLASSPPTSTDASSRSGRPGGE